MAGDHLPLVKHWRHRRLITEQAFDKLLAIDCTLAEFDSALELYQVLEVTPIGEGIVKELLMVASWIRPLHVVVIVDEGPREEGVDTIHEPDQRRWAAVDGLGRGSSSRRANTRHFGGWGGGGHPPLRGSVRGLNQPRHDQTIRAMKACPQPSGALSSKWILSGSENDKIASPASVRSLTSPCSIPALSRAC